jgi:hypothetical protein
VKFENGFEVSLDEKDIEELTAICWKKNFKWSITETKISK